MLVAACKSYYIRSSAWPVNLGELVKPPDGGRSFVDGGAKALIDPWGAPFRFRVVQMEPHDEVYVWTFSPYGDGKKVLGKAPPAGKK